MNITGKARRKNGEWVIEGLDGKEYRCVGGDFLPRMEGTTVRIVGVEEDNFGEAFFGGQPRIVVQRVNTI